MAPLDAFSTCCPDACHGRLGSETNAASRWMQVQHLRLVLKEQEAKAKQQAAENARSLALLQRSKDMEMHRGNELQARLQVLSFTTQLFVL